MNNINTIQYFVIFSVLCFTGCASYYLEDVHSITNIPNNSPVPSFNRQENDVRINLQINGSTDANEKAFNDGHYMDSIITPSGKIEAPYSSLNIKLRHTQATGFLGLDYTINDHLFIYAKIGSGILDDQYYLAENMGLGYYFIIGQLFAQFYLFTGGSQLYSDAVVLQRSNYLIYPSGDPYADTSDAIFSATGKSMDWEPGGGFQFMTIQQHGYWPNVYWGLEYQKTRYLYLSNGWQAYYLSMLIPAIGVIENIGKYNQIVLSFKCPINMSGKAFIWPSFSLEWSFQTDLVKKLKYKIFKKPA